MLLRDARGGIATRNLTTCGKSIEIDLEERILRNSLDIIILKELKKRPLNGYHLIQDLHEKYDIVFSSGTIYGLLYSLERKSLITVESEQRGRIYALTPKGFDTLKMAMKIGNNLLEFLKKTFNEDALSLEASSKNDIGVKCNKKGPDFHLYKPKVN